jgi:hypothetical protein
MREAFLELTGHAPHIVISRLARTKLDPNREIAEAAQEDPFAENAWREFQSWIRMARTEVETGFTRGMYFDVHGHGHEIDRIELGYLLTALSFGGYLEAEGFRSVPSPSDPHPDGAPYFTGGYNTRTHGSSADGEFVSGIQLEHQFNGIRDTAENRLVYAESFARVVRDFMLEHYGYFEPTGG